MSNLTRNSGAVKWEPQLSARIERCCNCDAKIEPDKFTLDNGTCLLCIECAAPLLTLLAREDRAA